MSRCRGPWVPSSLLLPLGYLAGKSSFQVLPVFQVAEISQNWNGSIRLHFRAAPPAVLNILFFFLIYELRFKYNLRNIKRKWWNPVIVASAKEFMIWPPSVGLSVCLFDCQQDNAKKTTIGHIPLKFHIPSKEPLNFFPWTLTERRILSFSLTLWNTVFFPPTYLPGNNSWISMKNIRHMFWYLWVCASRRCLIGLKETVGPWWRYAIYRVQFQTDS